MSIIQKVATQAYKTFSELKHYQSFQQQLLSLRDSVSKITCKEVCLDERLVNNRDIYKPDCGRAPVTYIHLWEDDIFTMGIFVLRNGVSLPLHDHPFMHGVIKVIHGTVRLTSYSLDTEATGDIPSSVQASLTRLQRMRNSKVLPVKRHPVSLVNSDSSPCLLFPQQGNFHEISSHEGPAAFLDILSPPYDRGYDSSGDRTCHYYQEIDQPHNDRDNVQYLVEIPQPREFYCEAASYEGPDIDVEYS